MVSELVDRLAARHLAQVASVCHGKVTATDNLQNLNYRLFATRYQPVDRQRFLFPGLGVGDAHLSGHPLGYPRGLRTDAWL